MSCFFCGGESCGGSGGGRTMCNKHPDNRQPSDSRPRPRDGAHVVKESYQKHYGPFSTTRGFDGRLNTWDSDGNLVRSEED